MPRARTTATSTYDVHPSVKMVQEWIVALPKKSGRSLDEWLALVRKQAPKDEVGRREWLKKEHGLGTNTAWWIAERSFGRGEDDDPEKYLASATTYVEELYTGKKAALRPLHDALVTLGRSIGKDVKVCPCKTIVPFYRQHVIAQIKPSTNTRIDMGFALGDTQATGRLIDTGGFAKKDRITHRIPITSLADVDAEVKRWLKVAYARDA
jgi:hypothetical protein